MEWKNVLRPGYFGKRKAEKIRTYNEVYGENNWRLMWTWNDEVIDYVKACQLYETAYYEDSQRREGLWKLLFTEASEVYDHEPENVLSGTDYNAQSLNKPTHIQDIAIRNVGFKRGWKFKGNKLIQIRSHADYWGKELSPGTIKFHVPELIIPEHVCPSWCDKQSVECFYQDNKILQIKI